MVMVEEVGRHAMKVADMSKTKGTEMVPTVALDRPEARGFKVAPETDKESPQRYVGIVARKATKKSNARAKPNTGIGKSHTTTGTPKELEMDRAHPL